MALALERNADTVGQVTTNGSTLTNGLGVTVDMGQHPDSKVGPACWQKKIAGFRPKALGASRRLFTRPCRCAGNVRERFSHTLTYGSLPPAGGPPEGGCLAAAFASTGYR